MLLLRANEIESADQINCSIGTSEDLWRPLISSDFCDKIELSYN